MSDFINSAVNTKVYNEMQDEHQIISIIDKEVIVKDIGNIVSGDTNSCLLSFEINRFQDGIDLCDKKIRFNYKNTNGIFYDIAVNVKYNDTTIRFSWLLPYSLTQPGGKSIASIEFYGYNEYDEQYSYKTKNFRLSIEKSIGITDESNKADFIVRINTYQYTLVRRGISLPLLFQPLIKSLLDAPGHSSLFLLAVPYKAVLEFWWHCDVDTDILIFI